MAAKKKAKKAKKATKKKAAKKTKKAPASVKPEFGIEALAKKLDVEVATARAKLRAAGVEKTGRYYDFGSAKGIDQTAKKLAA